MRTNRKVTIRDVMKVVTKALNEITATRRDILAMQRIMTKGAEAVLPWTALPAPRRRQVEAAADYLKLHKDRKLHTLPRAARETFVPAKGGYPNAGALASYLYSVNIDFYV